MLILTLTMRTLKSSEMYTMRSNNSIRIQEVALELLKSLEYILNLT